MKNLLFTAFLIIFSLSLISQTDVLPPVLDKPANAGTNQMPDVQLDWFAVNGSGPVTYELQLDTTDLFQNPVIFITSFSAQKAANLLFGNQYYWRVRAMDNSGTSGWSETRNFTIFSFVALNKPNNGSVNAPPDVLIQWKNQKGPTFISGITYYDLEVSLTEDFINAYYVDSVAFGTFPSNAQNYEIKSSNLLFDTAYYWRVRARHSLDVSDWSEVWSFNTIGEIALTDPHNDTINQNPDVELKWAAISGVVKFVYQVCTDPNFTFPCITAFTEKNSVIVPSLAFGASYHWRVKGAHLMDTTNWSQEWNFTVINTVLLESPQNGASGINNLPLLKWKYIRGADQYEVRWNNENYSISDLEIVDTNFFLMFKPLELGEDIFWQVRAINNLDTTDWSNVWQFHTGQQGAGEISLSREVINLYPNPSNGIIFLELNSEKQTTVQITVLDFVGKIVFEDNHSFGQGLETRKIDVSSLSNGLYFFRLKSGETVHTEKLILDK